MCSGRLRLVRDLQTETERLSAIVDDLFTLVRVESGQQRVDRRAAYLDDIPLAAVERIAALAQRQGVNLTIGQLDEAPSVVDARLVEQMIVIVIDNAIKYSDAGGSVTVSVHVEVDGTAVVSVADEGVGIPAAAVAKLFDRFYRGGEARARSDGAGLGLAIARWIADAHDAEIAVESTEGVGTCVRVRFPTTVAVSTVPAGRFPATRRPSMRRLTPDPAESRPVGVLPDDKVR